MMLKCLAQIPSRVSARALAHTDGKNGKNYSSIAYLVAPVQVILPDDQMLAVVAGFLNFIETI